MSDSSTLYTNLIQEAIKKKNDVTAQSVNQLELMYSKLAKELAREARKSNGFSKAWLNDYSKFMKFKAEQLYGMQLDIISGTIKEGARISASVQGDFYTYIGGKYDLDIPKELLDYAYSVNDDVLALIINGGFYKDNRSLSERIWNNVNGSMEDIQYILTKGMASNKSYLEIIKDLESYVNPKAKKPWDFGKVYPGIRGKKVDYNAQRLLRTSVTQMYQLESLRKAKENPYITRARWNLSSSHFERQVKRFGPDECDEYAGVAFHLNKVPVQHPQCLCYITYDIPKSLDQIGKEIKGWLNGEENKKLDKLLGEATPKSKPKNTGKGTKISKSRLQYEYKECKTIKEATSFAKKLLGAKEASYNGLDISSANEFNKGLVKALNTFPELKDFVQKLSTGSSKSAYAAMGFSISTVYDKETDSFCNRLNPFLEISKILNKNIDVYNAYSARDKKSNFHSERTGTMPGTMAHELMHAVQQILLRKRYGVKEDGLISREDLPKFRKDFKESTISKEIAEQAMKNLGYTTKEQQTEAVKELGRYALTSKDELLAEAMADYVNSKEPLPFSKEVVRLMQEKLKE